jgi:hypothetical protein
MWHVSDQLVDIDRAMKAAKWVEKQFGLVKVKNAAEWRHNFMQAWWDKPWA